MESNMRKIMETSWRAWIDDKTHLPYVDTAFAMGFESCHDTLMPLLIESYPHVLASVRADTHVVGYIPQRRPIDGLVERIKAVLPE